MRLCRTRCRRRNRRSPQKPTAPNHVAELPLTRLAGVSGLVPLVDWLLYGAIRKEALLTSQIEGTQATLTDLFDEEAGALGIDATPIERFDPKLLDQELALNEKGLKSVVLVALCYRSAEDFNAKLPKSRLPENNVISSLYSYQEKRQR